MASLIEDTKRSAVQPEEGFLANLSRSIADLIEADNLQDFFGRLSSLLNGLITFDYLIVYQFEAGHEAKLLYCNIDREVLLSHMAHYQAGLYLLDPFYVAAITNHQQGVYRIDQVAPMEFEASEYYNAHYKQVTISDEVRYLIQIDESRWVHIFVERDVSHPPFSGDDFYKLKSLEPLVRSLVVRRWERLYTKGSQPQQLKEPLNLGIRSSISRLGDSELTKREIDVVELVLKGHASKSIADHLCISEGTVNNHKRNLYAKLGIKSQGQLFNVFLSELFG
ncbi:MAG: hypothetical protein HN526_07925 [Gammaproteobacteria bacterium]|mgnify:CR=1 FL=1|jgi:DNA-binding CsgD family transcriptional regulator|nr:hypothetical protein [Gammaproteobacteria bacterium]